MVHRARHLWNLERAPGVWSAGAMLERPFDAEDCSGDATPMVRSALAITTLLLAVILLLAAPPLAAGEEKDPAAVAWLSFSLNLADVPDDQREGITAQTVRVFLERLIGLGLPDPSVFQIGTGSVEVVVAPNIDLEEVVSTLGRRGLVEFREQADSPSGWKLVEERGSDGALTPLTSAYFKREARFGFESRSRQPQVEFEMTDEGAVLMEAATRRLIGKPMGIFYDDQLIIAPVVHSVLRAEGVIVGLSAAEAKRLVVQLNSGVLPVEVTLQSRS